LSPAAGSGILFTGTNTFPVESERYALALYLTFLVAVLSDFLTKHWIRTNLALGETRPVIHDFLRITHWRNSGAAFGMFRNANTYLAIVGAVCIVLAIAIYPKLRYLGPYFAVALGLVAGGAMGNLIDRVVFKSVTDFISVKYFSPIFNVADSAIVLGSFLMICVVLFSPQGSAWK